MPSLFPHAPSYLLQEEVPQRSILRKPAERGLAELEQSMRNNVATSERTSAKLMTEDGSLATLYL